MTNWLISVINSKLNTAQETWNAPKGKKKQYRFSESDNKPNNEYDINKND